MGNTASLCVYVCVSDVCVQKEQQSAYEFNVFLARMHRLD